MSSHPVNRHNIGTTPIAAELDGRPVFPPRALVLTVLGAFIRRLDGWISIAGLIRVTAELGIGTQSVRSAVSRLKRRGIISPARRWGAAGYVLSPRGDRLLRQGDLRIFGRPRTSTLGDGWAVVVFSVPDSKRSDRHVVRSRLTWLGFGNLTSAVWLAPWGVAAETKETLTEANLDQYVDLFHAHYDAFGTPSALIERAWDLEALEERYRGFVSAAAPIARRWRDRSSTIGSEALADYVAVVTSWRPLTFLDAGLPAEALPATWPAPMAWDLFHELAGRLEEPAIRHAMDLTGSQKILGSTP